MTRVLITGVSGVGKSSVIAELASRGYRAIDADDEAYSHEVEAPPGELTGLGPGRDWVWREDRIAALLSADDADPLFLSGCSPNQGKFYPRLHHVVLLTAPASVIVQRLATRTDNPFGKRPDEVERVLRLKESVEPLLRTRATAVVDTGVPLDEVVEAVLRLAGVSASPGDR